MALQAAADEGAAADAAESTNASDEAEAIAGNKSGFAQRWAVEKTEGDDASGNVGDAGTQMQDVINGYRGVPPSDWINESPVQGGARPVYSAGTPMAAGGTGLEGIMMNAAIIGRIIWMAIEGMGGGGE